MGLAATWKWLCYCWRCFGLRQMIYYILSAFITKYSVAGLGKIEIEFPEIFSVVVVISHVYWSGFNSIGLPGVKSFPAKAITPSSSPYKIEYKDSFVVCTNTKKTIYMARATAKATIGGKIYISPLVYSNETPPIACGFWFRIGVWTLGENLVKLMGQSLELNTPIAIVQMRFSKKRSMKIILDLKNL